MSAFAFGGHYWNRDEDVSTFSVDKCEELRQVLSLNGGGDVVSIPLQESKN